MNIDVSADTPERPSHTGLDLIRRWLDEMAMAGESPAA
jgi:hypothetical protein